MRWLVTGARGQLGHDLQRVLAERPDAEVHAVRSAELDITDRGAISQVFAEVRPEVVINAAAYTAVDQAESDEDRAFAVNATGPALLAAEATRSGAGPLQPSTDYVFDGTAPSPIGWMLRPTRVRPTAAPSWPASWRCGNLRPSTATSSAPVGFTARMARTSSRRWPDCRPPATPSASSRTRPVRRPGHSIWPVAWSSWPSPVFRPAFITVAEPVPPSWHGFAQAIFTELGADPGGSRRSPAINIRCRRPSGLLCFVRCRVAGGWFAADDELAARPDGRLSATDPPTCPSEGILMSAQRSTSSVRARRFWPPRCWPRVPWPDSAWSAAAPAKAWGSTNVDFTGHGYGHGRGMGQWGAYGYAVNSGWSWQQILDHYYGGTTAYNQGPIDYSVRLTGLDGVSKLTFTAAAPYSVGNVYRCRLRGGHGAHLDGLAPMDAVQRVCRRRPPLRPVGAAGVDVDRAGGGAHQAHGPADGV